MSSNECNVVNTRSDCHSCSSECEEQALTGIKTGMDINAACHEYSQIIEGRIGSVKNQLQSNVIIIKEKVKHELHGQLNSIMKIILR